MIIPIGERVSALEAKDAAHEGRHDRFEDMLTDQFKETVKVLTLIDSKVNCIESKLDIHVALTNGTDPSKMSSKIKTVIIDKGTPLAAITAVIWLIIDKLFS